MKKIIKNKKGVSLAELMVSVTVFSLISIALAVIFTTGMKSWRTVESKSEAESSLNKSVSDINFTIRNSDLSGIRYCSGESTGIKNLLGKTEVESTLDKISVSIKQKGCGVLVCPSYASVQPLNDTSNSQYGIYEQESSRIDSDTVNNFYVLYFCVVPNDCSECNSLFADTSDFCPHKMLVKRWYKNSKVTFDTNVSFVENESKIPTDIAGTYSSKKFDKILAKNVIGFSALKNENTVDYAIKVFKPNVNQTRIETEDIQGSVEAFYAKSKDVNISNDSYFKAVNSTDVDPINKYVLQINSAVAPL
ncbi:prepilin-type N-terminal cleavage/methylation domain-containing protein [bacterium]|nr:prepilin-type N-terminal cleavage/methylation domain-containing protein [bacterium]